MNVQTKLTFHPPLPISLRTQPSKGMLGPDNTDDEINNFFNAIADANEENMETTVTAIDEMITSGTVSANAVDWCTCSTALHRAVEGEHLEIVKLLIDKGASMNESDENGNCPLHNAARHNGHTLIAKLLIDAGADVNKRVSGDAPLHSATLQDRGDFTIVLLAAGADINVRDIFASDTPLLMAISGRSSAWKVLLQAGADPTSRHSKNFTTPLQLAARRGCEEIVSFLLDERTAETHTAGPFYRNSERHVTPLYFASMNEYSSIAKLLMASCVTEAVKMMK